MQTVAETAAVHETTGKFVDNQDLAVLHDVVHIPLHQVVGTKRLIHIVVQLHVVRIREVLNVKVLLALRHTFIRQGNLIVLLVDLIIRILQQRLYKTVGRYVHTAGIHTLSGNNQRRSGFIDEDGVHLVHDGEVQLSLNQLFLIGHHVVPQVVETELVVGSVCDIAAISRLPVFSFNGVGHAAHGESQEVVDLSHPFRVTACQVIVDGNYVHALAGECIQVCRQGCHQGLTFTGLHLGNSSLMKNHTADELHPEVLHAYRTPRTFPAYRKGFRQKVVQGLPVGQSVLKLLSFSPQLVIRQLLHILVVSLDTVDNLLHLPDFLRIKISEYFFQKSHSTSPLIKTIHLPPECPQSGSEPLTPFFHPPGLPAREKSYVSTDR